jgi:anti-anti-sigma factor
MWVGSSAQHIRGILLDADGLAGRVSSVELGLVFCGDAAWARVPVRCGIDVETAYCLEQALREAEAGDPVGIAVDLALVGFISAAGVRALNGCWDRLRGRARRFVLLDPTPFVAQVLRVGGLADAVSTTYGSWSVHQVVGFWER